MCDCDRPDYDDEEGEELYDENEVVAELSFPCCECNHPIKAGEKYRHIRGCWDGDWSTYGMCLSCSRVSDRLSKELNACHCFGGLYDELINSDILCRDELDRETYFCSCTWLKVVSQSPLRCDTEETV
ncbi:MAG: hypothetical protein HWQ38_37830 [Nostoc sp. NMS7]|uniref:hypothetical protein n=1 Tax=Nostoc sp. NMS7 TaxID=2815391 RepID=UPI0025E0295B|nr:hypothetical protein [Nostoc sp. NMS7]MBN3951918.1 hypothetical protein [Nostoc sp. NMS7]